MNEVYVVLKEEYYEAEKAWARNEQRKDGSQRAEKSGEPFKGRLDIEFPGKPNPTLHFLYFYCLSQMGLITWLIRVEPYLIHLRRNSILFF
jgi:hypothetical protein